MSQIKRERLASFSTGTIVAKMRISDKDNLQAKVNSSILRVLVSKLKRAIDS